MTATSPDDAVDGNGSRRVLAGATVLDGELVWQEQRARDENLLCSFLGFETVELSPGRMSAAVEIRDELVTAYGMIHGGVISALVDHVLASVCYGVIPQGSWSATMEFKINFIAPVRGGRVVATAEIVSMSKRTGIVRIDVENDGVSVAVAQGTVMIMAPKPPAAS